MRLLRSGECRRCAIDRAERTVRARCRWRRRCLRFFNGVVSRFALLVLWKFVREIFGERGGRWKILEKLTECDFDLEPAMQGDGGLREEQGVKSEFDKTEIWIGGGEINAGQIGENSENLHRQRIRFAGDAGLLRGNIFQQRIGSGFAGGFRGSAGEVRAGGSNPASVRERLGKMALPLERIGRERNTRASWALIE